MKKRARESDLLSSDELKLLRRLNARLLEMAVKFGLVVL